MNLQSDICVIGNGAVGKTAALGFAQAGLSVTLLSPAPALTTAPVESWDVRVYALNHVAHSLLSSLRVWDALDLSRVAPVDAMAIAGDGDGSAGRLGFDAYGARVGALAWIVEDRNLNQALDAALKFMPKVRQVVGRATAVTTVGPAATLTLENGDTLDASLLVGADGAHSWLRAQCEIGYDYRSYGQRGVVSNFECEKPHHGVAHQWFCGVQGIIALLPLPGQRVSLVWSAPDALADQLVREPAGRLAERLAHWAQDKLGALTPVQPEAIKAFPLSLIRPHAITAPRVALVGDAAHVVHPLAGHGMNLGFGDVAALMAVLADVDTARDGGRDYGNARALRRYARVRKEEVLLMQLATDGLQRMFGSEFEPLRLLRNAGMNLLDKLPVLKRRLIAQALGRPVASEI
ncbi:MAG TPA: FAD-dependent monooxygenase [Burkholderiaceae bacterium]|jgi:ubiquinone biosynthesis UbiH/UbiF/VisC/COQ6 family hydroxylase